MARFKLDDPIRELHGQICSHSDTIYKQMYGTKFTSKICNPRTKPFTAAELERQTKFKTAGDNARAILADADQRADATKRFNKQHKYKTLFGFLLAEEYAKL